MKRKFLFLLLLGFLILGMIGCSESKKEVTLNSAFILDYENKIGLGDKDKAHLIVVLDLTPQKDILLNNTSISLEIGDKKIDGELYDSEKYTDILYDSYNDLSVGETGKLAYIFIFEKYLYKENSSYNIRYKIGAQKGEYSYIIEDSLSLKKEDVKEATYIEDVVKGIYRSNRYDALMIMTLKYRINDVLKAAESYHNLDFYNSINYGCYSFGAHDKGDIIGGFFGYESNTSAFAIRPSISNRRTLGYNWEGYNKLISISEYESGDLDNYWHLNYNVLEKYFPGIINPLIELNMITNKYAYGLTRVKTSGNGTCFRDITIEDVAKKARVVDSIMKEKSGDKKITTVPSTAETKLPTIYVFYQGNEMDGNLLEVMDSFEYSKEYKVVKYKVSKNDKLSYLVSSFFGPHLDSFVIIGTNQIEADINVLRNDEEISKFKNDLKGLLDTSYSKISNGTFHDVVEMIKEDSNIK